MASLSSELRNRLDAAVKSARQEAEKGARKALQTLAVDRHEPFGSMSVEERALRNRLQARCRQLGDMRHETQGTQRIDRLAHEVAYEHWHRMLFARFLAESGLLIEPDSGVAITTDECTELARETGEDPYALAARFAQSALPQIFRTGNPVLDLSLPPETQQALERLIDELPRTVFTADDSLGWVYQFWQSRKKDEINRSEVKIGPDELPAVTQLFTEPYMVSFLLDNTLGAWWASRRLSEADLQEAGMEADLRRNASIPGVPLSVLRFVRSEDTAGQAGWRPVAGSFDGWSEHLGDLKILDPCCGSGHFLVAALSMLVPMRMALEGLNATEAVDTVLRDNLHGLELDPRCVELAAFALALAAWTYPGAEGYRPLPELNLACSGLAPNAAKEQWAALSEQAAAAGGMPLERDLFDVDDNLLSAQLRNSLEALHDLFEEAPVLGSLIAPRALEATLYQRDFESVRALFSTVLEQERTTDEQIERAVTAQGMARAAELLTGRYTLVITNVPYLARGKQGERLRSFCERRYPAAKNDLATVFLERCLELCGEGGTASLVLPQSWLFLTSYRKLREKLLKTETWHLLARLGPGAFETISGEVVKATLLTLSRCKPAIEAPGKMYGLDVSEYRTASEKAAQLSQAEVKGVEQARQLENPDARVVLDRAADTSILAEYTSSYQGITTGDNQRFIFAFWETNNICGVWKTFQSTGNETEHFRGRHQVFLWEEGKGYLVSSEAARIQGQIAWEESGVAVRQMRELPSTLNTGSPWDMNCATIVPKDPMHLPAIWCFCSSPEYNAAVRRIDQKLNVTNATLAKVPFDLDRWTRVAQERYPNGLPRPYSDDPTQWIFHGHPCGAVIWDEAAKWTAHGSLRTESAVLQVAVARLLGYRWPAERDDGMELADEQREWVRHCETLHAFSDKDGIVCIPAVRGEPPARERLLQLLAAAFGDAWNNGVLTKLLAEADSPSLDDWLRNRFFEQHCKLFRKRPFVWHIWDGNKDGFHCLVNAHRLTGPDGEGRRTLEAITYSYLGGWIDRQRADQKAGKEGADGLLAAALGLQDQLKKILVGEPPFDLFIRWKPLHEQPIGWNPDINDGVRLNIRPFMKAEIRKGGKKGAGILRWKPNIKWAKDKGKEPTDLRPKVEFPWFWSCPGAGMIEERTDFSGGLKFDGNRWNDLHYTNACKKAARERKKAEAQ